MTSVVWYFMGRLFFEEPGMWCISAIGNNTLEISLVNDIIPVACI